MLCPLDIAFPKNGESKPFLSDEYEYGNTKPTIIRGPPNIPSILSTTHNISDVKLPKIVTNNNNCCPYCKQKFKSSNLISSGDTLDLLAISTLTIIIYSIISK